MKTIYKIWEKAQKPNFYDWINYPEISSSIIEKEFEGFYPGYNAILFSSGRSAIGAILKLFNLSRSNLVFCSPWSSHCVLNTISTSATPITNLNSIDKNPLTAAIIYHQWGYLHKNFKLKTKNKLIINDFADSLLMKNAEILKKDLDFLIISLPKSIGTFTGGIILCRSDKDAESLRLIRDRSSRKLTHIQTLIKYFSYKDNLANRYWNSVEPLSGRLTWYARKQIWRKLKFFDNIVNNRLKNIEILSKKIRNHVLSTGIIPSGIPINKNNLKKENFKTINKNFLIEEKHFNTELDYLNDEWTKTLLIPTHLDKKIIEKIKSNYELNQIDDCIEFSPLNKIL